MDQEFVEIFQIEIYSPKRWILLICFIKVNMNRLPLEQFILLKEGFKNRK